MKHYCLTAFERNGHMLLNLTFQAKSDTEARQIALKKLSEQNFTQNSYRCTTSQGDLILFK
ncbi:YhzD family protein [Metabacillus malikii]|uniref:Uncharacterized protein n=1 Tax=Metabacillus malikii TaxID=1504265 RepID=A0ABT9ZJ88_9BACI|nr:YhzD family protein [Metabacillus malikii]MDQ0232322.1 hypothetical protein [Metabacillus malikii]